SRLDPEIQGVAAAAALEAVEQPIGQVDGEAAAGAGRRAVQRARATLLSAAAGPGPEAKQLQDCRHADRGADPAEVDGGALRHSLLTLLAVPSMFMLGLAQVFS